LPNRIQAVGCGEPLARPGGPAANRIFGLKRGLCPAAFRR